MCKWGTETIVRVKIPADLSHTGEAYWKDMGIDSCIAPLVKSLQEWGLDMRSSCCGHGKRDGEIIMADGKVLVVRDGEIVEGRNSVTVEYDNVDWGTGWVGR